MTVLAVIPARGGSRGVPRKNVRPLAGRPLIVHTVEHALAARTVDAVVVSTDDAEIAAIACGAGATVIRRPPELAGDRTPTLPVLLHALEELRGIPPPDVVVTLQPTSPLRRPTHVDEAVALLDDEFDAVVGVCEPDHSPFKMFTLDGETLRDLIPGRGRGVPRQQLPAVYRENGAVYVSWRRTLLEKASIWGDRARAYRMDAESSIDIDTEMDFRIAEMIIHERRHEERCRP